jgi:hypothetical protein
MKKRQRVESSTESSTAAVEREREVSDAVATTARDQWTPPVRASNDYESIASDLEEAGVCVIGNILLDSERRGFEDSFWEAMTKRKPALSQQDTSTWIPDNYVWRGNYGAGQYKHYGMAQEEHCWKIRKNKTIRDIFEKAVHHEECVVSLDGAAALFEPTVSTLELHVDLVPTLEGFDFGSVQGAYSLFGVETEGNRCGACFMCVPGSHRQYQDIWNDFKASKGFKPPKMHRMILDSSSPLQNQAVKVIAPPNSLVLWKSELQHKNYGGDFTSAELGHMCRLVMFVAWQPKRCRSEKARLKKISMVKDGSSGNHWAALASKVSIKPFPPWGVHSIPVRLPFAKQASLPADIEELL